VNGNFDIGVFDIDGVKVVSSGATAQAVINSMQAVIVNETWIGPGLFYVGLSFDNVVATTYYINDSGNMLGCAQQANAYPLPAVATFATASNVMRICGCSRRTVP
jgi:hypothetical protein